MNSDETENLTGDTTAEFEQLQAKLNDTKAITQFLSKLRGTVNTAMLLVFALHLAH